MKKINIKYFEPIFMWLIIIGIFGISQPWIEIFHRYGFTITLIGLLGFIVFSHANPKTTFIVMLLIIGTLAILLVVLSPWLA